MGLRAAVLATLLLFPACAALPGAEEETKATLRDWMTGTWEARAQDESGGTLEVRLVVVPIWTARWDGPWIYAEQALAARPESPYRQRVFHLRTDERGDLVADVFDLPREGRRLAGAWRGGDPFGTVRPEDLVPRTGCAIRFESRVGVFQGSTEPRSCLSEFRGARWASYDLVVAPERLETWERGFDAEGRQVWGPTGGPDVFLKVSPKPPAE